MDYIPCPPDEGIAHSFLACFLNLEFDTYMRIYRVPLHVETGVETLRILVTVAKTFGTKEYVQRQFAARSARRALLSTMVRAGEGDGEGVGPFAGLLSIVACVT